MMKSLLRVNMKGKVVDRGSEAPFERKTE